MRDRGRLAAWGLALVLVVVSVHWAHAAPFSVNARSAMVVDMADGRVLFEKDADQPIPPASITKVLTLYIVFDAIREGRIHLDDRVEISARAAKTSGSRMGVKAGTRVPLEELIKGMAVVSGNDACVAVAEHVSGSVDAFVRKMNVKARELGMNSSRFMTPNGLPAVGQLTTARDIAKLSVAYLRRFPDSLTIHSMQAYSYGTSSHHNANRLLGVCPGVDGLKTGFVCASGYNITATAKRGDTRILVVVMGARTPGIRLRETRRLLETGFAEVAPEYANMSVASLSSEASEPAKTSYVRVPKTGKAARIKFSRTAKASKGSKASRHDKSVKVAKASAKSSKSGSSKVCKDTSARGGTAKAQASRGKSSKDVRKAEKAGSGKQLASSKKTSSSRDKVRKEKDTGKSNTSKKTSVAKSNKSSKAAKTAACPSKKNGTAQKTKHQARLKGKDQG